MNTFYVTALLSSGHHLLIEDNSEMSYEDYVSELSLNKTAVIFRNVIVSGDFPATMTVERTSVVLRPENCAFIVDQL